MTDEEIKQLLKDVKVTKFKTRDEQIVSTVGQGKGTVFLINSGCYL
jgi:hypothetical protein